MAFITAALRRPVPVADRDRRRRPASSPAPALALKTGPPSAAQLTKDDPARADSETVAASVGAGFEAPFVVVAATEHGADHRPGAARGADAAGSTASPSFPACRPWSARRGSRRRSARCANRASRCSARAANRARSPTSAASAAAWPAPPPASARSAAASPKPPSAPGCWPKARTGPRPAPRRSRAAWAARPAAPGAWSTRSKRSKSGTAQLAEAQHKVVFGNRS